MDISFDRCIVLAQSNQSKDRHGLYKKPGNTGLYCFEPVNTEIILDMESIEDAAQLGNSNQKAFWE